jgi:acyl-CoA synthetase (NDP forming)
MKAVAVATAEEALEVLEHAAIDILLTEINGKALTVRGPAVPCELL